MTRGYRVTDAWVVALAASLGCSSLLGIEDAEKCPGACAGLERNAAGGTGGVAGSGGTGAGTGAASCGDGGVGGCGGVDPGAGGGGAAGAGGGGGTSGQGSGGDGGASGGSSGAICGDGAIDFPEECEPAVFSTVPCIDVAPETPLGEAPCSSQCTLDVSVCSAYGCPPQGTEITKVDGIWSYRHCAIDGRSWQPARSCLDGQVLRIPPCEADNSLCLRFARDPGWSNAYLVASAIECAPRDVAATVTTPNGVTIDATEATRLEYQQFLQDVITSYSVTAMDADLPRVGTETPFDFGMLSAACGFKSQYFNRSSQDDPDDIFSVGPFAQIPTIVDWCDAEAFCATKGMRLCGVLGDGTDEWYDTCSSGGSNAFPYGNAYEANTCNGVDALVGDLVDVATSPGCQSSVTGFSGVYDLSGNGAEWINTCAASNGPTDLCARRGGSYSDGEAYLGCDSSRSAERQFALGAIRCCQD